MCVVDEVVVFLSFLLGSEVYFLDVDSFRKVVNAQSSRFYFSVGNRLKMPRWALRVG